MSIEFARKAGPAGNPDAALRRAVIYPAIEFREESYRLPGVGRNVDPTRLFARELTRILIQLNLSPRIPVIYSSANPRLFQNQSSTGSRDTAAPKNIAPSRSRERISPQSRPSVPGLIIKSAYITLSRVRAGRPNDKGIRK